MPMNFEETVKSCRRLGVMQFKCPEFEFVLGGDPEVVEVVDKTVEKVKSGKRGRDGLTAEEQIEVYGRVIDAEE